MVEVSFDAHINPKPTREQVSTAAKNATVFRLSDPVRPWRASSPTVVLTTGYFDLLHAGHVTFLQSCKKGSHELLVVGVHSDELATQQKGCGRPILSVEHRIMMVQSMRVVDYVFEADCFYDETPYRILEFVKPDYVVLSQEEKESNRKADIRLFLSDYCAKHNLQLRTVTIEPPILHTTGIVERIRSQNVCASA
jgi:cytidyltransferase-like protein